MPKDIRIILIGAGNIGSRYLQGLAKLNFKAEISVFDISNDSLEIAKERIKNFKNANKIKFNFTNSFTEISGEFELAIISTTSKDRVTIIKKLFEKSKVKYWILEKVLVQSLHDLEIINNIFPYKQNVWVNHPRRLMNWHKDIRNKLLKDYENRLDIEIKGTEWGLACNALHFIDLVSWWTNVSIKNVNNSGLKKWTLSKRDGYEEVYGNLKINFDKENKLTLICDQGLESHPIIKIETNKGCIKIDENIGSALFTDGHFIKGSLEYISNLVPELIYKIVKEGNCNLPNLEHSIHIHEKFIDSLAKHRSINLNLTSQIVPIT